MDSLNLISKTEINLEESIASLKEIIDYLKKVGREYEEKSQISFENRK